MKKLELVKESVKKTLKKLTEKHVKISKNGKMRIMCDCDMFGPWGVYTEPISGYIQFGTPTDCGVHQLNHHKLGCKWSMSCCKKRCQVACSNLGLRPITPNKPNVSQIKK